MSETVKIVLVLSLLGAAGILWIYRALVRLRVSATGERASATVLSVETTGLYVNNHPVCELRVRVRPHFSGEPFEATIKHKFTVAELPRVQPGANLQVRFEPKNPRVVVIESF